MSKLNTTHLVKGENFVGCFNPYFDNTVLYEECSFVNTSFDFNGHGSVIENITFKDCVFEDNSDLCFISFDGVVRFENCRFDSSTIIRGWILKNGRVKFVKCKGLTREQFDVFKAYGQTLSEMGLYQVFRSRIINSQTEETVYKKVGIFDTLDGRSSMGRVPVGYAIAALRIPKGTVRYGDKNDKCRCERAVVIDVKPYRFRYFYAEKRFAEYPSSFKFGSVRDGGATAYEVGKEIKPDYFDYIPNVCSHGIHYFYDRELAEAYKFT